MKAPKCKLCGEPHWMREPHMFSQRKGPGSRNQGLIGFPLTPSNAFSGDDPDACAGADLPVPMAPPDVEPRLVVAAGPKMPVTTYPPAMPSMSCGRSSGAHPHCVHADQSNQRQSLNEGVFTAADIAFSMSSTSSLGEGSAFIEEMNRQ